MSFQIRQSTSPTRRIATQRTLDFVILTPIWLGVLAASGITEQVTRTSDQSVAMAMLAVIATISVMQLRGVYASEPILPRTEEISRLAGAVVAGSSALAMAAAILDWHIGAKEILIGAAISFFVRMLVRGVVRTLNLDSATTKAKPIIIVGVGQEASDLVNLLLDHPESGMRVAGVVGNLSVAERVGLGEFWLGPTHRLIELMHMHRARGAIVTATGFRGEQFHQITKKLFRSGHDVHITTGISRFGEGRFNTQSLCHEPLLLLERNRIRRWHKVLKRALDLVGASTALILASPIMALTALLIMIEDGRPILYTAPRAGRRGRYFPMYKFRSMVKDADSLKEQMRANNERSGPLFKMSDDPRITRIGKLIRETSIDELPQLFNVLKGTMSLVGPRPALPEEEESFDIELQDRFEVRPGITGLWQVEARSNAAFNAYRRLDLHYVENWTVGLDLRILLATVEQVLVSILLVPIRLIRRSNPGVDGIRSELPDGIATLKRPPSAEPRGAFDGVILDIRDDDAGNPPVPKPRPSVTAEVVMPRRAGRR